MNAERGHTVSAEPGSDGECDALLGTIKEDQPCRLAYEDIDLLPSAQAARLSHAHMQARFKAGGLTFADMLTEEGVLRHVEDACVTTHTFTPTGLVALFVQGTGGGEDTDHSVADARGSAARQQGPSVQNHGHGDA